MQDNFSKFSDKKNGSRKVYPSSSVDWAKEIETIGGSISPYDTKESWLLRAADKSGATLRQIRALYHGECTDPKFSLGVKIQSAADQARIAQAKKAKNELAKILANAANAMERIDPDFHRETIDEYRAGAREIGPSDSA